MSDSTITAKKIVISAGMSPRPEYYSGRGAKISDLNGDILFAIYKQIKEKMGDKQAEAFVNMIENIKSLSATNFLNCLYVLEANDWIYVPFKESDIDVGPDVPGREAIAFATLFSGYASHGEDSTEYIRNSFFVLIGHKDAMNFEVPNEYCINYCKYY